MFVTLNSVIVDADATNRQEMANFLTEHGATVIALLPSIERLPALLHQADAPQLVMLNLDPHAHDTLRTVGPIMRQFSSVHFFLMSQEIDAQLVMDAMHYGAKEFLPLPANPEKLIAGIERVAGSTGGDRRAKVIHVIPTIGGCGATTIACNVAANLAKTGGHRTCLMDLDLIRGAVAASFDLNPRYTVADVMSTGETLDKHLVDNALAIHSSSGLCVLARPEQPEDSQRITRAGFSRLLGVLTRLFDYVVLDSLMSVDPVYEAAIKSADTNVLVVQLNVPSIRNAERFIAALRRMGIDTTGGHLRVIINRVEKRSGDITPDDVAKTLGVDVSWQIPNDFKTAMAAINYGEPVVLRAPRTEVSESFGKLVQLLNGRHAKH